MIDAREIGGYFELDSGKGNTPLPNGVLLNSGRSALRHIVRQIGVKRIHVPYYTCPVVWDALKAEGCDLDFYEIDEELYPMSRFPKEDFVLYTNYFGCCGMKVDALASDYPRLIVDCAQAYYAQPKGLASFSSPRKFFGLPDGGIAYGVDSVSYDLDDSRNRMDYLVLRREKKTAEGYAAYRRAEDSLDELPILFMSPKTRSMLGHVKVDRYAEIRKSNFEYLDSQLKTRFRISRSSDDVPMAYPYLADDAVLRQRLIAEQIYVATYWPKLPQTCKDLQLRVIPLPIDQRYDLGDMERVLGVIQRH